MRWMLLAACLFLGGCAGDLAAGLTTGSIGGGTPRVAQMGDSLYVVRVPQAAGESLESVQNRALVEAARQARQAGGTHFIIMRSSDSLAQADSLGSLARSRPDFQVYIRIVTLPPDAQIPVGAVSVDEIEKFVAGDVSKPRG